MLSNPQFNAREWGQAPRYVPEGGASGFIPLDFAALGQLADREQERGTFQAWSEGGVMAAAPFFLDHLPAAFYRLHAPQPEFMAEHQALGEESIVIISGVLKIIHDGYGKPSMRTHDGMLYSGQVMNIRDAKVNMEAISVLGPADCLALAVYHEAELQPGHGDIPILQPK